MLAKILSVCLKTVITDLIHPDLMGFMPHGSTRLNLRWLHNNLTYGAQCKAEKVVVSLDVNKAFDSVEWPYLFAILIKMGFGPKYIKWVKLLYTKPRARIRVNGGIFSWFDIERALEKAVHCLHYFLRWQSRDWQNGWGLTRRYGVGTWQMHGRKEYLYMQMTFCYT